MVEEGTRATGSPRRRALAAFAAALVVGLVLGRFAFLRVDADAEAPAPAAAAYGDLDAATASLAAAPDDPARLTRVGLAALAAARRTADPALYARAEEAIARSRALQPEDAPTIVAAGLLALARHDFTGALALATDARRLAPLSVDPLGVEVDALVELGRYDEAATTVDEMVRRRPDVASLSRASYVAELRGDPDTALDAMQQAVAAAGDRGADAAYVAALLGDLHLGRGNHAAADDAYRRSLTAQAGQPQAELGRARLLAAKGDLAGALTVVSALTERIPLPDAVALHGDLLARSGDLVAATEQYELVRAIEDLNRRTGGVQVDLELARFEVSRIGQPDGDAARAVELATRARTARPTLAADDILAWALRRSGRAAEALPLARAAVRYGTADATWWWHLAAVEADLGRSAEAAAHLERAFAIGGPLPVLEEPEAAALAARLGVIRPGR
jgi:tetratricopeptide (TPR) repeat protein